MAHEEPSARVSLVAGARRLHAHPGPLLRLSATLAAAWALLELTVIAGHTLGPAFNLAVHLTFLGILGHAAAPPTAGCAYSAVAR